jgi:hypothetical protein
LYCLVSAIFGNSDDKIYTIFNIFLEKTENALYRAYNGTPIHYTTKN